MENEINNPETYNEEGANNAPIPKNAGVVHELGLLVDQDYLNPLWYTKFNNSTDIVAFFENRCGMHFINWFNDLYKNGNLWPGKVLSTDPLQYQNFEKLFNSFEIIYKKPQISLVEFFSLIGIILNEAGGFVPISEIGSNEYFRSKYITTLGNIPPNELESDQIFQQYHGSLLETEKNGQYDYAKFKGRGFNQFTGRIAYSFLLKYIIEGKIPENEIVNSFKIKWSEQLSNGLSIKDVLTSTSNSDWDSLFLNTDLQVAIHTLYVHQTLYPSNLYLQINEQHLRNKLMSDIFPRLMGHVAGTTPSMDNYRFVVYPNRVMSFLETV